jgi:RNA polymerase sigma-70 factor, ECF subfamily
LRRSFFLHPALENAMDKRGATLEADIMKLIPALRRFSLSLCHHGNEADDLVQETLLKALTKQSLFIPGTNLRAWLFTIMRNTFVTSVKRSAREQPMDDGIAQRSVGPAQELNVRTGEIEASIQRLATNYRDALMRVGVHGDSYDEAAENLHCALGPVKSRVSRARLLVMDEVNDNAPWT